MEQSFYLTLKEACAITGHAPGGVRNMLWKGEPTPWPVYKDPATGRLRVKRSDAEAYRQQLEACRVDAGAK